MTLNVLEFLINSSPLLGNEAKHCSSLKRFIMSNQRHLKI